MNRLTAADMKLKPLGVYQTVHDLRLLFIE